MVGHKMQPNLGRKHFETFWTILTDIIDKPPRETFWHIIVSQEHKKIVNIKLA